VSGAPFQRRAPESVDAACSGPGSSGITARLPAGDAELDEVGPLCVLCPSLPFGRGEAHGGIDLTLKAGKEGRPGLSGMAGRIRLSMERVRGQPSLCAPFSGC